MSSAETNALNGFARPKAARGSWIGATALRQVLAVLQIGRLRVTLPSGEEIDCEGSSPGVEADLTIHKWRALRRLASGGDIGFAKSYIDGDWSTSDLTRLIELVAVNGPDIVARMSGHALFRAANWLSHLRRANTRAGSRRNIEEHYDLGNDFYRLWLDGSMLYSSAVYAGETDTLEEAQRRKMDHILELLDVSPGQSVLEIGCGWGALACEIARKADVRVTGITLSPSQLAFAADRVRTRRLEERVDLRIEDYRDTRGQFDRIVSIEMIEAVGLKYWPSYFDTLGKGLKPGGVSVVQAITISEDRFEAYRARPDFIQRFIFPGGFLPTKSALALAATRAGLELRETRHFGASYALTLREWRKRFVQAWPQIRELGFDDQFKRLWEYYLCYCEAGFKTGAIDVGLYAFVHKA